MKRVETGVVQFEDDWPGVFIRGDKAFYYASRLRSILAMFPPTDDDLTMKLDRATLNSFIYLLQCSDIGSPEYNKSEVQKITRK